MSVPLEDHEGKVYSQLLHKAHYLPPYSPELIPIEQFWAIVKNNVKRNKFNASEDLHTRISGACNSLPKNT